MEIVVQGTSTQFFEPDEVILDMNFIRKGNSYEEVLQEGTMSVQSFITEILLKNGFGKEDLKTRSFVIREERKYDNITQQYTSDGFSYNQSATIKFDYNNERLAIIMSLIAKLDNPPMCQINFGLKNEKECRKKIVSLAYQDAEEQASIIAKAAGKKIERCAKVDFKPFTTDYYSEVSFKEDFSFGKALNAEQAIVDTFTPADIEITEILYCLWIAQ